MVILDGVHFEPVPVFFAPQSVPGNVSSAFKYFLTGLFCTKSIPPGNVAPRRPVQAAFGQAFLFLIIAYISGIWSTPNAQA